MRNSVRKFLITCIFILSCTLIFSACGFLDISDGSEKSTPIKMTAVYIPEEDDIYGALLTDWNFEVYLHFSDGTKEKTKKFEIVNENRDLEPQNSVKTYTLRSTEYDLTTSVDIAIPAYVTFPETREEFCQKFYDLMKGTGITQYTMDLERNEHGVITQAVFKKVMNGHWSYWYYLDFSNFPHDPTSLYFDRVKLDTNVQYDEKEMEQMKLLLISLTVPANTYTAIDAYNLMGMNDGKLKAGNVEYLAYFKKESSITFGPVYYLAADIIQQPVSAVHSAPAEPDTSPTQLPTDDATKQPQEDTDKTETLGILVAILGMTAVVIAIAVVATRKKKKNNNRVEEKLQPVVQSPQSVAPPLATLAPTGGKCVVCGQENVDLENVEIMIMGTARNRAMCSQCAAKYK